MKFSRLTTNGRITLPASCGKGRTLSRKESKIEADDNGIKIIPLVTMEEVEENIGFLGTTSQRPPGGEDVGFLGTKGRLLKFLMKEKLWEREL
ncbi:MAG: hypothetical protein U5J96_13890 [Ignavibacteriaceae bacterium]|nr:hypothetical protein [Ignavibacteriaceae bacterium]